MRALRRHPLVLVAGLTAGCLGAGSKALDAEGSSAAPLSTEASAAADTVIPPPAADSDDSPNQTGLPAVILAAQANVQLDLANVQPAAFGLDPNGLFKYVPPSAGERLYGPGGAPSADDVNQGLGNSSLMALLAAFADRLPGVVQAGIRFVEANADGSHTYLVRLHVASASDANEFDAVWVPTDDMFMKSSDGHRIGAQGAVLWPAVYEKAIVKLRSTSSAPGPGKLGYEGMNAIDPSTAAGYVLGAAMLVEPFEGPYTTQIPDYNTDPKADQLDLVNQGVYLTLLQPTGGGDDFQSLLDKSSGAPIRPRQIPSGGSLRPVADSNDLIYRLPNGDDLRLTIWQYFSVLGTTPDLVLIRSPYGHLDGFRHDDAGKFWMKRVDLGWVWWFRAIAQVPKGLRGEAAALHIPPAGN